MAVEDALPVYHHREHHSIRVDATPVEALAAARATMLEDIPLAFLLVRLRGLRARPGRPVWEALQAQGFRVHDPETLVLIGRPWRRRGGLRLEGEFVEFAEPGYAKMAVDLRASAAGDAALLETETRIQLTDAAARWRFRAYWLVIRPFSGLIRRLWLRAAKRRAEGR